MLSFISTPKMRRQAAHLCRLAGADETLIPHRTAEGRRRARVARMRPHKGLPVSTRLGGTD